MGAGRGSCFLVLEAGFANRWSSAQFAEQGRNCIGSRGALGWASVSRPVSFDYFIATTFGAVQLVACGVWPGVIGASAGRSVGQLGHASA